MKLLVESAGNIGVPIPDSAATKLITYLEELLSWNKKINLTAIREKREIVVKHFLDSIAYGKALGRKTAVSLLDIGAGAGFPGLPLKILYPDLDLTLLEPSNKKTAFLRHIIGTLHLNQAVVVSKRIEDYSRDPQHQGSFTYAVTRALSVEQVIPFAQPLLAPGGQLILCQAKPLESGLNFLGFKLTKEIAYELPFGYGNRVLSILEPTALTQ